MISRDRKTVKCFENRLNKLNKILDNEWNEDIFNEIQNIEFHKRVIYKRNK